MCVHVPEEAARFKDNFSFMYFQKLCEDITIFIHRIKKLYKSKALRPQRRDSLTKRTRSVY